MDLFSRSETLYLINLHLICPDHRVTETWAQIFDGSWQLALIIKASRRFFHSVFDFFSN